MHAHTHAHAHSQADSQSHLVNHSPNSVHCCDDRHSVSSRMGSLWKPATCPNTQTSCMVIARPRLQDLYSLCNKTVITTSTLDMLSVNHKSHNYCSCYLIVDNESCAVFVMQVAAHAQGIMSVNSQNLGPPCKQNAGY